MAQAPPIVQITGSNLVSLQPVRIFSGLRIPISSEDRKMQNGVKITTVTGRAVDPFALVPVDVNIDDIAHALSMQARFNGHCNKFYSIAEHSILVANLVPQKLKLEALLHDASEAYIGDIAAPIKNRLSDFIALEVHVHGVIAKKYGLPATLSCPVILADKKALKFEMHGLLPGAVECEVVGSQDIRCLNPLDARREFMAAFNEFFVPKLHPGKKVGETWN